jgi:hypothetical protein
LAIFYDLTQEGNAKELKDRIRVHPSVALRSYVRQREGEATKRIM